MSNSNGVKISVVTATWNCEETISDCMDSVRNQTYANREHVVIDGKSEDSTIDILESRMDEMSVLLSEPDLGIYDALNKGIEQAVGDVVGFLHADDLYADDDVLKRVAVAFEDVRVCAVYGDLQYVSRGDIRHVVRYWRSCPFSARELFRGWMPPHPTLYVRREWYERIGGFDTKYRISADYHSILKLFSQTGFHARYLPTVLVKMRVGGVSNRTVRNIFLKSQEDLDALRRTGVGGVGALIWKNVSKLGQFTATQG